MNYTPRPYLVIPKLVEQPTWGGTYIAKTKGWLGKDDLGNHKIGQSYELFSGSNLSLLSSSDDPEFSGELTNNIDVEIPTTPANSLALAQLVASNPAAILGEEVVAERGDHIALLIKFTQALGNSFQVHIRDGLTHPQWKPKPEAWFYFEPGVLTLGLKAGASWEDYEHCVRTIAASMAELGEKVRSGALPFVEAKQQADAMIAQLDPWQYVNTIHVATDDIIDLSSGGLHHSWEEDPVVAPLGNVLIELQAEAMDNVSTFRSFDKGKMAPDGTVRDVHLDQYFEAIDRTPETNDPAHHQHKPNRISTTETYAVDQLLRTRHFNLDQLTFLGNNSSYTETIARYKHIFVRSGSVTLVAKGTQLNITAGHSAFVPADCVSYTLQARMPDTKVLISY